MTCDEPRAKMKLETLKLIIDALAIHFPGCHIKEVLDESLTIAHHDLCGGQVLMEFTDHGNYIHLGGAVSSRSADLDASSIGNMVESFLADLASKTK